MADIVEVGQKLVDTIVSAVYPNGTSNSSVGNCDILVYQGWPDTAALQTALNNGNVHVSVFPLPNDRVTSVVQGDGEWFELSNNGTQGVSVQELRRQTRVFQITVWAGCFDKRDPVAGALDSALAAVTRFSFADGTQGVMSYVRSAQDDNSQKQGIYRRDLFYSVNYATTQQSNDYAIKEIDTTLTPSIGAVVQIQTT